jgi:hypothetical protein
MGMRIGLSRCPEAGRKEHSMGDEEYKLFTLTEAERTRIELEPVLLEAMDARRKMGERDEELRALAERIQRAGGLRVPYEKTAKTRIERDSHAETMQSALERIEATGCVVKDLDQGLLDFPSRMNNEDVYLCWRLGEDRIRFYHRQDEGFAGRKPIDPRDSGHSNPVQ